MCVVQIGELVGQLSDETKAVIDKEYMSHICQKSKDIMNKIDKVTTALLGNHTENGFEGKGTIAKMIGNFFFGMIGSMLGMYLGNVALNVFNKKDNIYKKNDSWGEYIAEGVKSGAFAIFGSKLLLKITAAIGAAIIKQIVDVLIGKKTFNMWGMVVDVIVGVLFVIAIHFSSTMLKKLPKKNRTNEFANRIKSLIKNIGQYITEKIKQILKLLFEFFKTFTKRFSISFAKKCAPQLLKIFR